MWIIQIAIQLGMWFVIIWGLWHLARTFVRTVIKQSMHEALVEHEKYLKDKPKWEDAIKRVQESQRKFQ